MSSAETTWIRNELGAYSTREGAENLAEHLTSRGAKEIPMRYSNYSNERFDRTQALAFRLTDDDRKAGRPAPPVGYSEDAWRRAEAMIAAEVQS